MDCRPVISPLKVGRKEGSRGLGIGSGRVPAACPAVWNQLASALVTGMLVIRKKSGTWGYGNPPLEPNGCGPVFTLYGGRKRSHREANGPIRSFIVATVNLE